MFGFVVNLANLWWFIALMKLKSVAFAKISYGFALIRKVLICFRGF
jgi:hypothetical protein